MRCRFAVITGSDYVPYRSTGTYQPNYTECDNPDVPEIEVWPCDESCPYYEPYEEIATCPPRYCGTCLPGNCINNQA